MCHRSIPSLGILIGFLGLGILAIGQKQMEINNQLSGEDSGSLVLLENIKEEPIFSVNEDGYTEERRRGRAVIGYSISPIRGNEFSIFGQPRNGFCRVWYTMKQVPNPFPYREILPGGGKVLTNEWECLDRELCKQQETIDAK